MLLWPVSVLVFSVFIMWYQLRCVVINPVLRPLIINTPGRMALFSIARLCTMLLGVTGVWYSRGWLAGIISYVATEVIRATLRRHYTVASIRSLTNDLVRWQDDGTIPVSPEFSATERLNAAREAAAETVEGWMSGKG
jgi:hypothetical protein